MIPKRTPSQSIQNVFQAAAVKSQHAHLGAFSAMKVRLTKTTGERPSSIHSSRNCGTLGSSI